MPRGRGAQSNYSGRYERHGRASFDDGWSRYEEAGQIETSVFIEQPKSIITKNQSPDVPFDRSINAYRGCEHGCVYCFARPTHAYMGLSPGLDFESKLFAKPNAAALLREELKKPGYKLKHIAMGTNTDPYQPIERKFEITRQILEVLLEFNHPATILTKSSLITRDKDILAEMAKKGLVRVGLSVTTLDPKLARVMEPRASTPPRRIDAVRLLSNVGIPVTVMAAPIVPALNDHELENILMAAKQAGAQHAGYILLRLPMEIKALFEEWLERHYPDRKKRVMNRLMMMRGGRANDARFRHRMRGNGVEADLLKARFSKLATRLGLNTQPCPLNDSLFKTGTSGNQYDLFAS